MHYYYSCVCMRIYMRMYDIIIITIYILFLLYSKNTSNTTIQLCGLISGFFKVAAATYGTPLS